MSAVNVRAHYWTECGPGTSRKRRGLSSALTPARPVALPAMARRLSRKKVAIQNGTVKASPLRRRYKRIWLSTSSGHERGELADPPSR